METASIALTDSWTRRWLGESEGARRMAIRALIDEWSEAGRTQVVVSTATLSGDFRCAGTAGMRGDTQSVSRAHHCCSPADQFHVRLTGLIRRVLVQRQLIR